MHFISLLSTILLSTILLLMCLFKFLIQPILKFFYSVGALKTFSSLRQLTTSHNSISSTLISTTNANLPSLNKKQLSLDFVEIAVYVSFNLVLQVTFSNSSCLLATCTTGPCISYKLFQNLHVVFKLKT